MREYNETLTNELCNAIIGREADKAISIIKKGAEINDRDNNKWTPLHYAAYHDDVEMAQILLSRGSPTLPLAVDVDGNTPLLILQWYYKEGAKVSSILCICAHARVVSVCESVVLSEVNVVTCIPLLT